MLCIPKMSDRSWRLQLKLLRLRSDRPLGVNPGRKLLGARTLNNRHTQKLALGRKGLHVMMLPLPPRELDKQELGLLQHLPRTLGIHGKFATPGARLRGICSQARDSRPRATWKIPLTLTAPPHGAPTTQGGHSKASVPSLGDGAT